MAAPSRTPRRNEPVDVHKRAAAKIATQLAESPDQIVLISGDGDFRSLVSAVQAKGRRVSVISTLATRPPVIADDHPSAPRRRSIHRSLRLARRSGPRSLRPRLTATTAKPHSKCPTISTNSRTSEACRRRRLTAWSNRPIPSRDCPLCPRLVDFPWAPARGPSGLGPMRPFASFGPQDGRGLLIVGLAPGLQGANRTGVLSPVTMPATCSYGTLLAHRLCRGQPIGRTRTTNYAAQRLPDHQRCALRPAREQADAVPRSRRATSSLEAQIAALPQLRAILALGRIAHDAVLTQPGRAQAERFKFVSWRAA